ncbi:nicotianamine synthase-like protein [Anaerobacterium chartisolvens]|uniref:Nicotianamine synthase-like protein n=1 Tax=Anaerobacterium chartisolvens TaxID=1297424 RepID=A0A369BDV1_9FIRM|nr:nicotianamine synthase family protein [Anaerobacterium chartisolvens]RCX19405.1 nicotianamine synthase-like protein [Anaerobacterium chartisolvens]
MTDEDMLVKELNNFLSEFRQLNISHKQNADNYKEMEKTIGEFSSFILNKKNDEIWKQMENKNDDILEKLVEEIREQSAFCVWAMEKYRAVELQKNREGIAEYFSNIEACIETEFGSFEITADSKVLLIGAGAFPMTPLLIARRTGAEVVGIDIDPEAVNLARIVVGMLDKSSRITIKDCPADQLEFTREATHIVFASTVKEKFDILNQLHPLTNKDVVVAMRYGDGFKSLFNYPLQDTDSSLWNIVNNVSWQENVFDIALYKKA